MSYSEVVKEIVTGLYPYTSRLETIKRFDGGNQYKEALALEEELKANNKESGVFYDVVHHF